MSKRSELRAQVEEISGRQCEHPLLVDGTWFLDDEGPALRTAPTVARCWRRMQEMAHITSIGMGGRKSADDINNVMAACNMHARSTDDHSSREWNAVAMWAGGDNDTEEWTSGAMQGWLREYVRQRRRQEGWDV